MDRSQKQNTSLVVTVMSILISYSLLIVYSAAKHTIQHEQFTQLTIVGNNC